MIRLAHQLWDYPFSQRVTCALHMPLHFPAPTHAMSTHGSLSHLSDTHSWPQLSTCAKNMTSPGRLIDSKEKNQGDESKTGEVLECNIGLGSVSSWIESGMWYVELRISKYKSLTAYRYAIRHLICLLREF